MTPERRHVTFAEAFRFRHVMTRVFARKGLLRYVWDRRATNRPLLRSETRLNASSGDVVFPQLICQRRT